MKNDYNRTASARVWTKVRGTRHSSFEPETKGFVISSCVRRDVSLQAKAAEYPGPLSKLALNIT